MASSIPPAKIPTPSPAKMSTPAPAVHTPLQAFSALRGGLIEGATLSVEGIELWRKITQLLPHANTPQLVANLMRKELGAIFDSGGGVTQGLISLAELAHPYLEPIVVVPKSSEAEVVLEGIYHFLGLELPSIVSSSRSIRIRESSPISRILDFLLEDDRIPDLPSDFVVAGHKATGPDDPKLTNLFPEVLFGKSVSPKDLLNCFSLTPPFHFGTLMLTQDDTGHVHLQGNVAGASNEFIRGFYVKLPPPPTEPDEPWVALLYGFDGDKRYERQGIAEQLLRGFLKFLYRLGLDSFDINAYAEARYFCAKRGFITRSKSLEEIKRQFLKYVAEKSERYLVRKLTVQEREKLQNRIASLRDIGRIADFEFEERSLGKSFLAKAMASKVLGDERRDLSLRFELRPDFPGWLRILDFEYPLEWNRLSEVTRNCLLNDFGQWDHDREQVMTSDQEAGHHLADFIRNRMSMVSMYLELQGKNRSAMPELLEKAEKGIRCIADVLNFVASEEGTPLHYHFQDSLLNTRSLYGRESLLDVLKAIEERGIPMRYRLAEREGDS